MKFLKFSLQVRVILGTLSILSACDRAQETVHLSPFSGAAPTDRCGQGYRSDAVTARAAGIDGALLKEVRDVRALSNDDICTLPKRILARAIFRTRTPKPDFPGKWAAFRAMEQQSDDGTVDPNSLIRGLQSRQNFLQRLQLGQIRPMDAGVSSKVWKSLGPGNLGGRIRTIAISPKDPNKIWIGSVSGGIWASRDDGASWNPVNDFMASVAVSTMVIDPIDPNIMYAGTGEGFFNGSAVRGAGVFKSTDEGKTWHSLAATSPKTEHAWYYVNRLAIHPKNSKVILAATRLGIFRTADGGNSWSKVSKV